MLKNIDPLLEPMLLAYLREMGHGDEIVIADANFPAASTARRLVRCSGVNASRMLEAVLSVLPLDPYVSCAVHLMNVVKTNELPPIASELRQIVSDRSGAEFAQLGGLDRFDFYERAKHAFAVVATGETRLYGNVILTKGVIG